MSGSQRDAFRRGPQANWKDLTEAERDKHLRESLRRAGVPEDVINERLDDFKKDAKPGKNRKDERGSNKKREVLDPKKEAKKAAKKKALKRGLKTAGKVLGKVARKIFPVLGLAVFCYNWWDKGLEEAIIDELPFDPRGLVGPPASSG